MSDYQEYRGMTYEQASREACRLLAPDGAAWFKNWDRLAALREIMIRAAGAWYLENGEDMHHAANKDAKVSTQ